MSGKAMKEGDSNGTEISTGPITFVKKEDNTMKKKIFCLVLAFAMCSTILTPAVATDNSNTLLIDEDAQEVLRQAVSLEQMSSTTVRAVQPLYSFNDQQIATMYYLSPCGYAIYDPKTGIVLESSEEDNLFFTDPAATYYYPGVLTYLSKQGNNYIDLATSQIISADEVDSSNTNQDFYAVDPVTFINRSAHTAGVASVAASVLHQMDYSTRAYNCNVTDNFSYFGVKESSNGVCGSVALAILSAYYDDNYPETAGNGDWASNTAKNSGISSANTYGIDLVKEIVQYVEPKYGDATLLTHFDDYLLTRGVNGSTIMTLSPSSTFLHNQIDNEKPTVIGLHNEPTYHDHWVFLVGYYSGSSPAKIAINDGWGNKLTNISEAVVASAWHIKLW